MNSNKLLRTVLILVIATAAISGTVDNVSKEYAEQSLSRALVTFTAARALNGAVSVAQGTEVAVEPGGVGVILTPGQILDPINDLIERFSGVMLVAASSLGLQLVLLEISSWWVITAMLIVSLAVWLSSIWSRRVRDNKYVAMTVRLTLMLTFLRLAVPVVVICTNLIFDAFLLTKHDSATAELNRSSTRIAAVNVQYDETKNHDEVLSPGDNRSRSEKPDEELSEWDSFLDGLPDIEDIGSELKSSSKDFYSGVADWFSGISVSTRMDQLKASAENATRHIVDLIVIFVLQTILFPLGFLWIFVEVMKAAAVRSISAIKIEKS
ncbi:MAG: hypothetical protein V3T31_03530 [candidate division Zixibacteria bacterium]